MYRVTFYKYSRILGREFWNVEFHNSKDGANLRAKALGWTIETIEPI